MFNKKHRHIYSAGLLAALTFSLILTTAGCSPPFTSNGERIYVTSTSDSGEDITYTGGPVMMMRGRLACYNCHGPDGHGGRVNFMMQTFDVPDITWPELTQQHTEDHMEHPPYTEETLKKAITTGIEPSGEKLDYPMPRWQMSGKDLDDLVDFIKTLK